LISNIGRGSTITTIVIALSTPLRKTLAPQIGSPMRVDHAPRRTSHPTSWCGPY